MTALLTDRAAVSLQEAAQIIGISKSGAYNLAQSGNFPCRILKVGGRYIVPTAGLRELLDITATA
ncbi:helix-turn-helix transcriptional regulator [Gordonia humi]|uniref:Putative DNA-binding transcriptional regulator AlpA n=1 Tax=Gordonia humi TaxID=686429 RepID=A0A840ESX8_9ACTN|nr:helix-turn-helix domain-containing protein [Gordonia humi]MBB4134651.1 putative DNA-binding transcriptional regulator AlpA [Gordonia humi]